VVQYPLVRAHELAVQAFQFVEVPPLAYLDGQVAERHVPGPEQLRVPVQPEPAQDLGGRVARTGGHDPHTGGRHAEAEPGQFGAQDVPPVPFGFGDREDGEQPAVVQRGPLALEDPRVALAEDGQRGSGQLVAGRPVLAPGLEDPPPFQPRYRRTHGRLVHAEVGEQPDQHRDGQPAAGLAGTVRAGVHPVHGDDQVPGWYLLSFRNGRHHVTIT
jgi:hypothetical protein